MGKKTLKQQRNQFILSNHENDMVLKSILPEPILSQIKQYGFIPPKCYHNKVVIFVGVADFNSKSGQMSPGILLKELHTTFNQFDIIIKEHHCTRIKAIGNTYLAVCGMFDDINNTELEAVRAAEKMRAAIMERNKTNRIKWEVNIGLYSGDVICSSVSSTNLSFDIFGETVNMASLFQKTCDPMQINISDKIQKKIESHYKIISRSPRKIKEKGIVPMFYVHKPLNNANSPEKKEIASTSNLLFSTN